MRWFYLFTGLPFSRLPSCFSCSFMAAVNVGIRPSSKVSFARSKMYKINKHFK